MGYSAYVRTDVIRRVLVSMFNIDVVQVMGVTDIDDKIIQRTKEVSADHLDNTIAPPAQSIFFNEIEYVLSNP